jgi:hypothetical protein
MIIPHYACFLIEVGPQGLRRMRTVEAIVSVGVAEIDDIILCARTGVGVSESDMKGPVTTPDWYRIGVGQHGGCIERSHGESNISASLASQ